MVVYLGSDWLNLGCRLARLGWSGIDSAKTARLWSTCLSSSNRVAWACSHGSWAELQESERKVVRIGTCMPSLPSHSIGQSHKSTLDSEWGNRLHFLMGGASKSHCKKCGYREAMNWDQSMQSINSKRQWRNSIRFFLWLPSWPQSWNPSYSFILLIYMHFLCRIHNSVMEGKSKGAYCVHHAFYYA